jgi:hypothetical protein
MKKVLTLLGTIALLAAAPILAEGDGVVHSATGSGHLTLGDDLRTFAFSAVERSDGTVTGQALLQARLVDATGHIEIDCLNVVGNVALISGTGRDGTTRAFAVEDNGEGGTASPDRITLVFSGPFFTPGVCMVLTPADAAPLLMPIEEGNVQVR